MPAAPPRLQNRAWCCQLTELHRFTDPAEAAASAALLEGKPRALNFYLDHDRIHVCDIAKATEDAFTAWIARPTGRN